MAPPRKLDSKELYRSKTALARKVKANFPENIYYNWLLKDIDPDTGNKMKKDSRWLPPDMVFPKGPESNKGALKPGGPSSGYAMQRKRKTKRRRTKKRSASTTVKSKGKRSKRKRGRSAAQKAATARMLAARAARFDGDSYERLLPPSRTSTRPAQSSRPASQFSKQPPVLSNNPRPYIAPNY